MEITLATKITIARIFMIIPIMIIYIVAGFMQSNPEVFMGLIIASGILYVLCCSTDFIDGYIARKTNTVSTMGKFLDPIADKVIVVVMLFLLVYFDLGLSCGGTFIYNRLVIAILSSLILSRELIIGVFRSLAASKGLVLAADIFGKIKTIFLDAGITILILAPLNMYIAWIGTIAFYIGAFFAIYSGFNYVIKNKQVLKA